MKRHVSFVPVSVAVLIAACFAAGCDDAKPDKSEFASICSKHMGSSQKCGCYADSLEKSLPADQFGKVLAGVHDVKDLGGSDWIPPTVRDDGPISQALSSARIACFGA